MDSSTSSYFNDQIKEIFDCSKLFPNKKILSLFPIKKIDPDEPDSFLFEKERLPRQVKSLIEVSNPNSISSGNVFFHGEELFWISSSLKLIIFNPKKLSNVIEYDIDYPIQIIFSSNLYLILSHIDSYVTLIDFPAKFSDMFDNDETEEYNFYNYTKNKESILKSKLYPRMLRPVPSSFYITAAYDKFIGCSDGVIRSFQVVGHSPDSNFFIKRTSYGFSSTISSKKKIPILSLKKAGNYLYSIDALNNLSAYLIGKENQIVPIDSLHFSNIASITPFSDFLLSTKQVDGKTIVSTVLNSQRWYRIKKSGVIISQITNNNEVIKKYNREHSCIYRLNTFKETIFDNKDKEKKENQPSFVLWPVRAEKRASGNTVIIYLRDESIENLKFFEYQVEAGNIITFVYDDFEPPIPFISSKDQFFPFTYNEKNKKFIEINYIVEKKPTLLEKLLAFFFSHDQVQEKENPEFREPENKISSIEQYSKIENENNENAEPAKIKQEEISKKFVRPIEIFINEIDEHEEENVEQSEDAVKKYCLCVIGEYKLVPPPLSLENDFGISTIHHSIWSTNGSLLCIIDNIQPNFGTLLTIQSGIKPVANIQNISGRILAYNTNIESDTRITKISDIEKDVCESLYIFTSDYLFVVSLNETTTYKQKAAWNFLKSIYPFWTRRCNIKNLREFREKCLLGFGAIWPQIISKFSTIIQSVTSDKFKQKDDISYDLRVISQYRINAVIKCHEALYSDMTHYVLKRNDPNKKDTDENKVNESHNQIQTYQKTQDTLNDLENLDKFAQNRHAVFNQYSSNKDIEGLEALITEFNFDHHQTDGQIDIAKKDCLQKLASAKEDLSQKLAEAKENCNQKIKAAKEICDQKIKEAKEKCAKKIEEAKSEEAKNEEDKKEETKKIEEAQKEEASSIENAKKEAAERENEARKEEAQKEEAAKKEAAIKEDMARKEETDKIEEARKRTKTRNVMFDCFLVWISEEIEKLLTTDDDDDDDELDSNTSEYIIHLSQIRDRLMNFQTRKIIFE